MMRRLPPAICTDSREQRRAGPLAFALPPSHHRRNNNPIYSYERNEEQPIDLTGYYGYLGNGKKTLFVQLLITAKFHERTE